MKPTPDEGRLFAIFLDEYHVSAGQHRSRARVAVDASSIATLVAAGSRLVVMKPLDSLFAIRLTRDREAVAGDRPGVRGPQRRLRAAECLRAQLHRRHAGADRRRAHPGGAVRDQRARGASRQPARPPQDADRRQRRHRPRRTAARTGVPADARHHRPVGEPLQRGDLSLRSRDETPQRRPDTISAGSPTKPTARRSRADARRRPSTGARRRQRLLPAVVSGGASRRRTVSSGAGAGEASEHERPRAQGLLGAVAGRSAARGAARAGERAEGGRAARAGAARQPAHPRLVRHDARRGRQDARHVRLGAGAASPGDRVRRRAGAALPDRARSRQRRAVRRRRHPDRPGAGRRARRHAVERRVRHAAGTAAPADVDSRIPPSR